MCARTKFGPNVTASIEAKKAVFTEVDPDILPMLKMEKEETEHITTLNYWGKFLKQAEDEYFKFSRVTR